MKLEKNDFNSLWEELKNEDEKSNEVFTIAEMVSDSINRIIKARNKLNMTQRDLAAVSGIKQSAIARLERLNTIPRLDTIAKLAYHVGLTIELNGEYDNNYVEVCMTGTQKYKTSGTIINYVDDYSQKDFETESLEVLYR